MCFWPTFDARRITKKKKASVRTIDSTFGMSSILTNMITSISHSTLPTLQIVLCASSFSFLYPNHIRAYTVQAGYLCIESKIVIEFPRGFFLYLDSVYFHTRKSLKHFQVFPFSDCSNGTRISQCSTWNTCRMNGGNSNWRLADKLPQNCWSRRWKDLVTWHQS